MSDEVKCIKEYFGYSTQKALEIQHLLTKNDKKAILDALNKGG
jgi:hypothetical protein